MKKQTSKTDKAKKKNMAINLPVSGCKFSRGGNFACARQVKGGSVDIVQESWESDEFEVRMYPPDGKKALVQMLKDGVVKIYFR